jgi:hypothetical protein
MATVPQDTEERKENTESRLSTHHYHRLSHDSAISDDVIAERGYRTITEVRDLEALGFSRRQLRNPGLLCPVYTTDGQQPFCLYRPDDPYVKKDGKSNKYENPPKRGARLDCPPRCRPLLADPAVPLWLTEGSKKADALASKGACAIALLGVWGFKGPNPFKGQTFLADWDYVALNGRRVSIVFDSDVMTKSGVQQALGRIIEHLRRKGADVFVVYLPSPTGQKVGVDDFLASHTMQELQALVKPYDEIPADEKKETSLIIRLATAIVETDSFAQDAGGKLYLYQAGRYVPRGDRYILTRVKTLLASWNDSGKWSSHTANEVLEYIRVDRPVLWERPPLDLVCLRNGILDLTRKELRPHSPAWLSTVQLPIEYEPSATCPAIETFVAETFPADARALAYEIPADLLIPDRSRKRCCSPAREATAKAPTSPQ